MHGFIKFARISAKSDEDLPFKHLVTFFTSLSVTGKMNMVLG
jgi:hypothetical protein